MENWTKRQWFDLEYFRKRATTTTASDTADVDDDDFAVRAEAAD